MKKKSLPYFKSILIAFVIITAVNVFANQIGGSSSDPVVTKSYVDSKINKALEQIKSSQTPADNGAKYTPVFVSVGQSIIGKEGTELIMRSGKGLAIIPTKEGISDITAGKDILKDEAILKNHLVIIPRDDGRGIKVTENAWFLVRGGYTIN